MASITYYMFRELLDTTATNPVVTDTPRNRAVSVTTGLSRGVPRDNPVVTDTPRYRAVCDGHTAR